ncbi:NADH dehydrogenase (quinone) [Pirellula staleyi DSM 6068]|uniref:NADH-quinone oxidoreductase subunit H n=1 Tax=Pirellula staleyi (strain ATCC 27377 / DSM 6068 / ICPB 4128) TaxID=530564 RepID=D2QWK6_PIRSD|nr:NADH-quinone oxidoreductase subunit NuoH [Pirellula staleyi]ADB17809.1 NADH dehydrogenase (quinone) [Pirellula staleyi DSM 6068]
MAEFINVEFLSRVFAPLGWSFAPGSIWGYVLAAAIHIGLLIQVVAVGALVFIWMERKIAGRIQDRLGPTRVGGKFGWLQTLADGLKLIAKEDVTPKDADRLLFKLAPYVSFAASFTAYMALPFSSGWVAQDVNIGVFFIVAVLGLEVFGVILAGYASGSKWSLFGGMREAAQVVSYEVPIGMCIVIPVVILGTMNLVTIGDMQAGWFTNWLIFNDPFTFAVFFVYFTCATASVNRAPFDLAEAESELVAGFHTEYSGLRWSFFFMAEYGSMFLVSGLAAILFFGGWNGPIPLFGPEMLGWAYTPESTSWSILGYIATLAGCVNFIGKTVLFVTVMMWVRWTLPRLRIDQVMTVCLKYCVPLAAFCFIGAVAWRLLELPTPSDIAFLKHHPQGRAAIREGWIMEQARIDATKAAAAKPEEPAEKPAEAPAAEAEKAAAATEPAAREAAVLVKEVAR